MNNTHRINVAFAISKAQDAVKNWELGVAKAKEIGTPEQIKFCEESLAACVANLEAVKKDVKDNWHAYL